MLAVTVAAAGPLSYAPEPRRLHAPDLAQRHSDRQVLARRGRRRLRRPARDHAVRRLHRGRRSRTSATPTSPTSSPPRPRWYVLPILVIGLAGGVGQGVLNLYASGLDLEALVPRLKRVHTTLITSIAAVVLLYVGTFALNAVDSITAMTLVLNGLAAPWVVVNLLGFLVARRGALRPATTCRPSTRAAAAGATGSPAAGTCARWSPGPPAPRSACCAVSTSLYTGPLANVAGGVDLSLARLGARRRRRLPHRPRSSGPEGEPRMIDPLTRWAAYGEKPDYAGLLTFAGLPYTEDPAELAGADVAIVGAPMDELDLRRARARASARGRSAPRAARPAPHLEAGVDALRRVLRVVDFGDAPILPADPVRSHAAIEETVGAGARRRRRSRSSSAATTRSPSPTSAPAPAVHGPVGLIHFDAHTDTGREVFGVELSHGSPMYRLVESGHVDPARYVQIGLRGYWPGEEEFAWQQRARASRRTSCTTSATAASAPSSPTRSRTSARGPVFLSVDVDVLDPAFAPGTGTPEPGGMTSGDLLWACREIARERRARRRRRGRGAARPHRHARHHRARRRPRRPRAAHRRGGRARARDRARCSPRPRRPPSSA